MESMSWYSFGMHIGKYTYYFRQPRSVIAKNILEWVATAGVVAIAATSPFFLVNLVRASRRWRHVSKKEVSGVFYRLRREGCLLVEKKNNQIYISLSDKGRKKTEWLRINHLAIQKPKRWDGTWRIVIFDIAHGYRLKREALRGFLKRLGFYQLQKSVWVHPYDCRNEINLLINFFGFSADEVRLITVLTLGEEKSLKQYFKL